MLIKNHILSLLVLTGITLTTATSFASTSFTSLSECRRHYNTSIQSGNESTTASDNWCKDRMTALDFCTEQALLNAMATNSYNASQIPEVRSTLQNNCQRQLAEQANRNTTPPVANTGGGTNTPSPAFDPSGAPRPPTPPAQQNCGALAASEQAACNARLAQYQRDLQVYQSNLAAYNQRQAQAAELARQQEQQQQQQQAQAGMQGMQMMLGAMAPALNGTGGTNSGSQNTANPAGGTPSVPASPADIAQQNAALEQQLAANGAPTTGDLTYDQIRSATTEAGSVAPELRGPANEVGAQPTDPASVPAPQTVISQNATTATTNMINAIKRAEASIQPVLTVQIGTATYNFPATKAAMQQLTAAAEGIYKNKKEVCVKGAEKTEKLCLEGTSPGVRAAKGLMDAAGPILAVIGSAQKACSSTRKITNLAAVGITVAKGVCVASKVSCESTCSAAMEERKNLADRKLAEVETKMNTETAAAQRACDALAATTAGTPPPCRPAIENAYNQFRSSYKTSVSAALNQEGTPNQGTSLAMKNQCAAKGRDILLMATNILGLVMAKQSAQKCEKQLASATTAGGPGANISTSEYCSSPETSTTQFCRCQSNPTAEGCPGNLAAGGLDPSQNNQRGVNLKAGQGVNGFAGGTKGGVGGTDFNLGGGNGADSTGAALANLQGGGSVFGASSAMGSTVAGGGGGSATPTAAAAAASGTTPDKKWNFGAFASSGGGGTAARGGSAGGNGNMSQQQQEAIERKIASDKYAAEVTPSSGASNFDKIKKVVRQISSTLDPNQ